jgi:hypothetical protein
MGLEDLNHNFLTGRLEDLVKWARYRSIWPLNFGLACCAIELQAFGTANLDSARFGMEVFRESPRQADLLTVSGRVSHDGAGAARPLRPDDGAQVGDLMFRTLPPCGAVTGGDQHAVSWVLGLPVRRLTLQVPHWWGGDGPCGSFHRVHTGAHHRYNTRDAITGPSCGVAPHAKSSAAIGATERHDHMPQTLTFTSTSGQEALGRQTEWPR